MSEVNSEVGESEVERNLRRQLEALQLENSKLKNDLNELKRRNENAEVEQGLSLLQRMRRDRDNRVPYMVQAEEQLLEELAEEVGREFLALHDVLSGDDNNTCIELHEKDFETLKRFPDALRSARNKNWFFAGIAGGSYIVRLTAGNCKNGWVGLGAAVCQGLFTFAEHASKNEAEKLFEDAMKLVNKSYKRFKGVAEAALKFDKALRNMKNEKCSLTILPEKIMRYCERSPSASSRVPSHQKELFAKIINVACGLALTYQGMQMLPIAFMNDLSSVPYLNAVANGIVSIGSIVTGLCDTKSEEISTIYKHIDELQQQIEVMKTLVEDADAERS